MSNKAANQIHSMKTKKPWVILENGKKRYTRATAIDIGLAIVIPIIGLVFGVVALAKKEYKRGWTLIAIGIAHIVVRMIMLGN